MTCRPPHAVVRGGCGVGLANTHHSAPPPTHPPTRAAGGPAPHRIHPTLTPCPLPPCPAHRCSWLEDRLGASAPFIHCLRIDPDRYRGWAGIREVVSLAVAAAVRAAARASSAALLLPCHLLTSHPPVRPCNPAAGWTTRPRGWLRCGARQVPACLLAPARLPACPPPASPPSQEAPLHPGITAAEACTSALSPSSCLHPAQDGGGDTQALQSQLEAMQSQLDRVEALLAAALGCASGSARPAASASGSKAKA